MLAGKIVFPDCLMTTYKRDLPMIQQMDGTGEDMRLMSRFIQPIVSAVQKQIKIFEFVRLASQNGINYRVL